MAAPSSKHPRQLHREPVDPRAHPARFRGREISDAILLRDFLRLHYTGIATAAEVAADFLCLALSFALGPLIWAGVSSAAFPPAGAWAELTLAGAALGVLIFERRGLYRMQASLLNVDEMRRLYQSILLLALAACTVSFFAGTAVSPMALLVSTVLALVLVSAERLGFERLHRRMPLRGFDPQRVLIYGAGEVGRQLYQKIGQSPKLGLVALGFYDEDPAMLEAARRRVGEEQGRPRLFLSRKEELLRTVLSGGVDEVFIARPSQSPEALQEIVGFCRKYRIRFRYVPYLFGSFVERVRMTDIGGVPLIAAAEILVPERDNPGKKLFDKGASLFLLVALSPLFLLFVLLIRLTSRGPAFFRQIRVGKNGRPFRIFKFRTMYVDAPAYQVSPRSRWDQRITPVGRFLRRTSLDELPQLINVMRGEMSLVGPRPEMPFIVEKYNDLQRERLRVLPGITGLWQISADRSRPIHDNMAYDLYYIQHRSPLLDAAILLRTLLFAILSMKTC